MDCDPEDEHDAYLIEEGDEEARAITLVNLALLWAQGDIDTLVAYCEERARRKS